MTHPFHPLLGQRFELLAHRSTWGEDRVFFYDKKGKLRALPASWTDAVPVPVFVAIAKGRALMQPADLLRLAELVAGHDRAPPAAIKAASVSGKLRRKCKHKYAVTEEATKVRKRPL